MPSSFGRLGRAVRELDAQPVVDSVPRDAQRDRGAVLAEADQLAVRTRARREALRADVQRLEQVRLAGAVLAHDEHDAGSQIEVERRVRAVVAERDVPDDQPASRLARSRVSRRA